MSNLQSILSGISENFISQMSAYLPSLAAGLAILIVGWLVALLISKLVEAGLRRTSIDNRIAAWVKGEGEAAPDIEPAIGRGVFWLLMIFVLVAFFQALQLTVITGPLRTFLDEIFIYAPRLLSAAVLLLVAWLVASGVRLVVRTALRKVRLDERIGGTEGEPEGEARKPVSLTNTLSETVYWLIFLLFLPAILDALALQGLLGPIRDMVGKVLDFLPNLFGAAIIFLIGWFVARIIQRIVSNLLAAVGLDRLAQRVGVDKVVGEKRLSGLVGLLVYALILIPVLISALGALQLEDITEPASAMLDRILLAVPLLFGAALVLAIAYVIGRVVGGLVSNLLGAAGFDGALERLGLKWKGEKTGGASGLVGHLIVVIIMLFAAIEALHLLEFGQLATLVYSFTVFLGNVLLGLVVFGLGLYLSGLAARAIQGSGGEQSAVLATVARIAILVLAGAMALRQMNVAQDIINLAFGLVLGAAAVAAAVAFGIGGRDLAREQLERWSRSMRSGKGPE